MVDPDYQRRDCRAAAKHLIDELENARGGRDATAGKRPSQTAAIAPGTKVEEF